MVGRVESRSPATDHAVVITSIK